MSANLVVSRVSWTKLAPLFCALLLCCSGYAQQRCAAEAKLLLAPTETHKTVAALHAGKPSRGQIYLYDTDSLDLLSHGVIVRLRTGAQADLTVKLRSSEGETCKCPSDGGEAGKCEADLVADATLTSYSVRKAWKDGPFPETGEQLHSALSAEQSQVLRAAGISVDWQRVRRWARIEATYWEARPSGPLKKVTIELWEWPGGAILELSAKTDLQNGAAALRELRATAERNAIALPEKQVAKTTVVLQAPLVSAH